MKLLLAYISLINSIISSKENTDRVLPFFFIIPNRFEHVIYDASLILFSFLRFLLIINRRPGNFSVSRNARVRR